MVTRRGFERQSLWTCVAIGLLVCSCTTGTPVVHPRSEPFIYVVLNQREAPGTPQLGLITTLGSPTSSEYIVASKFQMTRTQDGRLFDFQDNGKRGAARQSNPLANVGMGNYLLPEQSVPAGSGASDLRPGDAFVLRIVVGADTIEGSALIPAAFSARVENVDGVAVVVWPKVDGAAGYALAFRDIDLTPRFQVDTTFTLPQVPAPGSQIRVKAMDANLTRYVFDSAATAVGISKGYGVFGAISIAPTIIVPGEFTKGARRGAPPKGGIH
jgi:hypothetical protein